MARFVVAVEGCPMGDGRSIDHKALSPRDDRGVPVLFENDWGDAVGWASDFQRDGEGNISFDIEWNARGFEMDCEHMFKHISVGQTLWDQADGVHFLATGVVYSVFVNYVPTPWDILNHSSLNNHR